MTLSVTELTELDATQLAAFTPKVLAEIEQTLLIEGQRLKAAHAQFEAAMTLKYQSSIENLRQLTGKDTGTLHFKDGTYGVVIERPKKVSWDQTMLRDIAAKILASGESPREFMTVNYSISERDYAQWTPELKATFSDARTVSYGKQKIRFDEKNTKSTLSGEDV